MNRRSREFRALFDQLPETVRRQAVTAFGLLLRDPNHPSLRSKELVGTAKGRHLDGSRSVAITMKYRAIFVQRDDGINLWYWIGTHNDYESFIGRK